MLKRLLKLNLTCYFSLSPRQAAVRRPATWFLYSRPRLLLIPGNLSHIKTSLSKNEQASAPAMQMRPNPSPAGGVRARPTASGHSELPRRRRPFIWKPGQVLTDCDVLLGPGAGARRGADPGTERPPAWKTPRGADLDFSRGFSSCVFFLQPIFTSFSSCNARFSRPCLDFLTPPRRSSLLPRSASELPKCNNASRPA